MNNKMDNKTKLIQVFKSCLNILRDNEGLTGEKALRNLSYFLILKLIEPQLEKEIKLDEYEYDLDQTDDDDDKKDKEKLLKIARFSNLSKEKEDNLCNNIKCLWTEILSQHPSTRNIFLEGKGFDITYQSTFKKIINKINTLELSNNNYDILGNAYEEVIKDIMTGKVLGQFFTQPLVKKLMVKLIKPKLYSNGKIKTCADPTMGTGGFLISYLQYIIKEAKEKNIELDWEYIKNEGIYGKEIEPDTYQLAVSNMLISSGHMFEKLDKGDSIRDPITRKFDNILANPPYGIKGLKYNEFQNNIKKEYTPIKSDNAVSLFIQAIIYMLKVKGKCAVVLPDGQDLFSKTNKTLITIREYLMKTCDLKEIIYLPSGIFTYTTIKTCIFYFIKKKEGSEVLNVDIKYSKKTQKEIKRTYKFTKKHRTKKIKFYEYNSEEDTKKLLVEVPIEKIIENSYSLNYAEYMEEEKEEQYEDDIVVKTLGEVCKFLPKSKRNAKYGNKGGLYPFFKSSTKIDSYVNEPDYQDESLIIGDGGEPNINYGIKFSASDHCYILQNKDKTLLNIKYAYYYLYHNLDMMKQLYTGVAIKNISKTNLKSIKIPIPSLDKQKEIVKYLDFLYERNKKNNEQITELKQMNKIYLNNQKNYRYNVVKTLGEVFNISKGTLQSSKNIKGEYTFITASDTNKTHNTFTHDCECVMLVGGAEGSLAKAQYFKGKFIASDLLFVLISKRSNEINYKYVWYYLNFNRKKYLTDNTICCGTPKKMISKNRCSNIKISIPPLERQKEIVEYCELNDKNIKQIKEEIENNKKIAEKFIKNSIEN